MDMSEIFVKNGEAFGMGSQKQDLRYGLFSSPLIHFCSSLVLEFCGRWSGVTSREPREPEDWICSWLDSI